MKNSGLHLITLHVTERCNLSCVHCYANAKQKAKRDELTFQEIKELVKAAKRMGVWDFHIEGGEPLLREDIVEIVKEIKKSDCYLELSTNGTLIEKRFLQPFKKYGLNKIVISIDGPDEEIHETIRGKGSFKRALRGLNCCLENDFPVGIDFTITSFNFFFLERTMDRLLALPINFLNFRRFIPVGRGEVNESLCLSSDQYKKAFLKILKRNKKDKRVGMHGDPLAILFSEKSDLKNRKKSGGCMAGRGVLNIKPNGDITPCMFIPLKIGNIRREALLSVWEENQILKKLRAQRDEMLKGKCGQCNTKKQCGGCRASAFAVSGDLFQADPLCWQLDSSF